jgi:hypothetical protein
MTNDFLQVAGADAVEAGAARLSAAGEELDGAVQAVTSEISAIEAEEPWGDDKFGQQFLANYREKPKGSTVDFSKGAQESMAQLGPEAQKIGDATVKAMLDYVGTDDSNAADINSLR